MPFDQARAEPPSAGTPRSGRHREDCAVRNAATDLKPVDLNVVVTANPGWTPGSEATVTADYPYRISLLGLVVKSGRMHSTTKERIE